LIRSIRANGIILSFMKWFIEGLFGVVRLGPVIQFPHARVGS
jgi:hypothetical protein